MRKRDSEAEEDIDLSGESYELASSTRESLPERVSDNEDMEARVGFLDDENNAKGSRNAPGNSRKHKRLHGRRRINTSKKSSKQLKLVLTVLLTPMILLVVLFLILSNGAVPTRSATSPAAPTGSTYASGFNMKNNWGSLSPYFDSGTRFEGIDAAADRGEYGVPDDYTLKQVHILHRHAERYPTSGTGEHMSQVAQKLLAMEPKSSAEQFRFLENWQYTLGSELLVASGVGTEFQSGADFWATHGRLLYNATDKKNHLTYNPILNVYPDGNERPVPVLRTTSQSRIQTSAKAWAAGFFGVYGNQDYSPEDNDDLYKLVLMPETSGTNNTLAPYSHCTNANNASYTSGNKQRNEWIQTYLEGATVRLQKLLPGYHNLTSRDAFEIQNLCSYETAAYGGSAFCELFTETEWRGYEYAADLDFYYGSSFGSPVSKAQGSGYIAELLARLEQRLITEPGYGVNTSLTGNNATFPIDQPFYLDMTHDGVIINVLTSIGFSFLETSLPTNKIPVPRQFIVSRLTPFGARLFFELLQPRDESKADKLMVRAKLNNRILPLSNLPKCPKSGLGLCPLDDFVASLKTALTRADFEVSCYGDLSTR